jgi:hypothetical protein
LAVTHAADLGLCWRLDRAGYELAPMTWKSWFTKMWWGQLTPM